MLSHKLINVVVVAVIYAVDVLKPSAPKRPLTIAHPTLGKRGHLDNVGVKPVAEVEVLYLNLIRLATAMAVATLDPSVSPCEPSFCLNCSDEAAWPPQRRESVGGFLFVTTPWMTPKRAGAPEG